MARIFAIRNFFHKINICFYKQTTPGCFILFIYQLFKNETTGEEKIQLPRIKSKCSTPLSRFIYLGFSSMCCIYNRIQPVYFNIRICELNLQFLNSLFFLLYFLF